MARTYSHRRNSNGNQLKALPMEAMYAAGASIFSLIIFVGVMVTSILMEGETPRFVGGIGAIGFLISIVAFIYNIGQMKTKTELKYRVICMVITTVIMIIWAVPFVVGLVI